MREENEGKGGCAKPVMIGCLGVIVFLLVAGYVGFRWVAEKGRSFGSDVVNATLTDVIQQSSLPAADKEKLTARIHKLVADFKAERISLDDLGRVAESIAKSPVLPVASIMALDAQYLAPAALDDKGREHAVLQLHRFARGAFEKKIGGASVEQALAMLTVPLGDGGTAVKEKLSPDELDAFIKHLEAEADKARVPDEKFEIDFVDELIKAIDMALTKKPA